MDQQNGLIVAAMNALTSAITSVIPGAKVSGLQAVVATEDEASSQPAGESEAEAGQVSATGGNGDDNGDDDKKPSAVTFEAVEKDIDEQTRVAAAVGLTSICKSRKKKD